MEVQKAQTHRNMIANPHHFPAEEGSCLEVAGPLPKVTEAVGGNARMKTQGPKTLGPGCFSLPWSHFSEAEAKYLLPQESPKTETLKQSLVSPARTIRSF